MKRRFIAAFLAGLMAIGLCGCDSAPLPKAASIEDEMISEPAIVESTEANIETETVRSDSETASLSEPEPYTGVSESWCSALFETPSTTYNNQLALTAAQMCAEAEAGEKEIRELYRSYNIYACEADYTNGIEIGDKEWFKLGGGAFAIGQDTLNIDGVDTRIVIITARSTKTLGEMIGDLMKGGERDFLGERVWNNIYDFEEKIWNGLDEYIEKYPATVQTDNLKILITGHSLGGAAANLIGAKLTGGFEIGAWENKLSKEDIYVYTFGAIKVLTTEENVSVGYENIHNIYNYYDSYGPNGNQKNTNASSLSAKFGHTDLYKRDNPLKETGGAIWDSSNNHLIGDYINAVRENIVQLSCAWNEIYANYLENSNLTTGSVNFYLIYIDDDDIPEVYCGMADNAYVDRMIYIRGGEAIEFQMWQMAKYGERSGLFSSSCIGHIGYWEDDLYRLDQDGVSRLQYGEYMDAYDSDGMWTGFTYTWNGEEISEEEYSSRLQNGTFGVFEPTSWPSAPVAVSVDAMSSYLKNLQ